MRVDVAGVVSGQPSMKGKSVSFKLHGGGPYLYAYGAFGENLISRIGEGTQIIASGSVNYAKDGNGDWEKYINLTGSVAILPNKISQGEEKAKLTFVTTGKISSITPQAIKSGNMAKFTVEETSVDFRGEQSSKHSMVAFEQAADMVLSLAEGQHVMVAGQITRIKGRNDSWYTSFNATAVVPIEVGVPQYVPAPVVPAPVPAPVAPVAGENVLPTTPVPVAPVPVPAPVAPVANPQDGLPF